MAGMIGWLRSGSESRRKLAGVVGRGIMSIQLAPRTIKTRGNFDALILDFRNRALVKRIIEDSQDRIFITYGANDLSGVFTLLLEHDPAW